MLSQTNFSYGKTDRPTLKGQTSTTTVIHRKILSISTTWKNYFN